MKSLIKLSLITLFFAATFFSCSSNDDGTMNTTHELVGTWERADSNANFEYKLIFDTNHSGLRISSENNGTTVISNATDLEWSTIDNELTLFINEEIITDYYFDSEGRLYLNSVSDFPFIKLD
ncbi:hypothetical protein ACFS5M_07465 [Lacinutrix iliipiscaria]|uniref:Lipocalin-like domain-containing protein n=1 Tax=Lacinutrix iliipiscaria TaxID=1230532 RepID=A0ABW5WMM0_9FLAO